MRRTLLGPGAALALPLAALAWLHHYGGSPLVTALGLPGPRADAGRRCGGMYRQTRLGSVQTREVVCRGPTEFRPGRPRREETVAADLLTRRVTRAQKTWSEPDSAAWRRAQDSVHAALARRGGRRVECPTPSAVALPHVKATAFWRFPGYAVRLVAYHALPGDRERRWVLQMDGYPGAPWECARCRAAAAERGAAADRPHGA